MYRKILSHYENHKSIIQSFIWRGFQFGGKQGIILFIFFLCAKFLAAGDLGLYSYTLATVSLLVLFGDFGISVATSKLVAEYQATDKEKLNSVLFNALYVLLAFAASVAVVVFIFGPQLFKDKYIFVLYALPLILLIPVSSLYDGVYRGLRKFKRLAIISLASGIIMLPLAYLATRYFGLKGALATQSIFYLLQVFSLGLGYREIASLRVNTTVMRQIFSYSFYVGLATLGYYLFSRIDVLILGHFGYFEQIASYELLNKIFAMCLVPFQIIAQVVAPNFSEFSARQNHQAIMVKFKKYIPIFTICAASFLVGAYYLTPLIISYFFHGYADGVLEVILLPVALIYALGIYNTVIHTGIILPVGYARLMMVLNLVLAACNAVLAILFLRLYGYVGVIYATLLLNFLGTIALQLLFYKKLKATSNV